MVVLRDVPTGDLVLEDVATDRPLATWQAVVDARLKALGAAGFSLLSDRATALIQRAEQGWACLRMPDVLQGRPEVVKRSARAMGQRLRQAQQERTKAQEAMAQRPGPPARDHDAPQAKVVMATRQAEGTRGEEAPNTYRGLVETRSLTRHPFRIADAAPQSSAQVERHRPAALEAIAA